MNETVIFKCLTTQCGADHPCVVSVTYVASDHESLRTPVQCIYVEDCDGPMIANWKKYKCEVPWWES